MSNLTLLLGDHSFLIRKKCIIENSDLFDAHPELYDEYSYEIESKVAHKDCSTFVEFLRTNDSSLITPDNAKSFLALGEEFGVPGLPKLCAEFLQDEIVDMRRLYNQVLDMKGLVWEQSQVCEMAIRNLSQTLSGFIVGKVSEVLADLQAMRSEIEDRLAGMNANWESSHIALRNSVLELNRAAERHWKRVECPFHAEDSLDGIITYLTEKQGGNVQETGIVTITSKSVNPDDPRCAVATLADFRSDSHFKSQNEPGQWVCWDFHEMCVRLTHYTMECVYTKSWVIEGSDDGDTWTEIDRQTDNEDFRYSWRKTPNRNLAAFAIAIANQVECRFIRLTQTGKTHPPDPDDLLRICAVEFFGVLSE